MSVTRRDRDGHITWVARWLAEGKHHSRSFGRKADAVAFEREVMRQAQLGAHAPGVPPRDALVEWLRTWWARDSGAWARSTRSVHGRVLDRWVVPYLGAVQLRHLGSARVRDWRAEIQAAGCPPNTVNSAMSVLSAALGAAVRDGLLPANPCSGIRRLPHQVARPHALAPLQVERIRAEMPTMRDVVLVGLLAYAGLRPEEALALTWGSVGRTLVIDAAYTYGERKPTKTHQRRSVEVIPPLARDLALLRPWRAEPDALVAAHDRGGHLDLDVWRRGVWRPAATAAGVKATPYDGRHTYASLLIHEGRSPLLVSAALGHASGELVWRRYAHVFEEARLAPEVGMVDAIEQARAELERAGLRPGCSQEAVRVLRS